MNKTPVEVKTARDTAILLLKRIELEGAFADRVLSAHEVSKLEPLDRAFVRELVLGVERWKIRLDHTISAFYDKGIDKLEPGILNILRIGLYQMIFMDSVPNFAAVNESVTMAANMSGPKAGGLVNAILRRFTREGEPKIEGEVSKRFSETFSYPLWQVKKWLGDYGPNKTEKILASGNERHPVSLRVNILKTTPEELIEKFSGKPFEITFSKMPGYLLIRKAEGLFDTDEFKKGLFSIQDSAASAAVLLLDPSEGEKILDLCSAPGGKTTHIAEITGGKAEIISVDHNDGRANLIKSNVDRLGLGSVNIVVADAHEYKSDFPFDKILVDVPCSGSGVFSKRPDMKYKREMDDVLSLTKIQKTLL